MTHSNSTLPQISFIVPVYNAQNYLAQCLNSILAQSVDKEIIVINDGSTDDSLNVALSFAKQYPQIKLIHYANNRGQSYARNQGLKIAKGEYIYCVDSDDYLLGDELAKVLAINQTHQADLLRVQPRFVYHDEHHNPVSMNYPKPHIADYEPESIYQMRGEVVLNSMLHHQKWSPAICWTLIKREFLQKHQLAFLEGVKAEDQLFYIQLLTCQPDVKVLEFPHRVYSYQIRFGSTIYTASVSYILDHLTIIENIKAWNDEHEFNERTQNDLLTICRLLHTTAKRLYEILPESDKQSIAHLFEGRNDWVMK